MYETKFIRRAVKKRRRILAEPVRWGWLLTLECGHELKVLHKRGETLQRPVCVACNQVAADLGRAEKFYGLEWDTNGHNEKR